jgi:integrase
MRGGECAQLLPSDFVFEAEIPHFNIQPGMLPEGFPKSHKNANLTLALPIPEPLLRLGLREFVVARSKKKKRLLFEIPILEGKPGNGIAKFWRHQFIRFGLHAPGRGTHGFRHTVAAQLRAAGSTDDEISLIEGRKPQTISGKYGVTQ